MKQNPRIHNMEALVYKAILCIITNKALSLVYISGLSTPAI